MPEPFVREAVTASAERVRLERQRLQRRTPSSQSISDGCEPARRELAAAAAGTPTDVAAVLRQLTAVQEALDRLPGIKGGNRVAVFNRLYFRITSRVFGLLQTPQVVDPAFLTLLDVEFAKLYFQAIRSWAEGKPGTPDAWQVLFRRAQDRRLTRLAAAALGVNAHVNHDLALALIETWKRLGPPGDAPHHDYLLINKIFFEEIPFLRRRFSTAWQLKIDWFVGELDDWSQNLLIETTRAMAWEQGRRLWDLQHDGDGQHDFAEARAAMDRAAALIGEALVVTDSILLMLWAAVKAAMTSLRHGTRRPVARRRTGATGRPAIADRVSVPGRAHTDGR
jgi:hypothetical protein